MTDYLASISKIRRFRLALAAGLIVLILAALWWAWPDQSNPKMLGPIKVEPPLGTLLKPGQPISLWVDPRNLDAPIYTWRVSFQGQIKEEKQEGRSFTFTPQQFGSYEVSLKVVDGETNLNTEPIFITIVGEPTNTPTPQPTDTPTTAVIPTSVGPPISISPSPSKPKSTPTLTTSSTPTPTPTLTSTLTLSPVIGVVFAENLWVRQGPGGNDNQVDSLQRSEKVTILRRTGQENWLEVTTPRNRKGWVWSAYIIVIQGSIDTLPIWNPPSLPTPRIIIPPNPSLTPIEGDRVSGKLDSQAHREYTFTDDDKKITIVLLFRPRIAGMAFLIIHRDQTDQWLEVGTGSSPASDQDGDQNTGELVWDSASLIPGTTYYLRLVNGGNQPVEYCLALKNDYRWLCD